MLCERCKKNEATFHKSVFINGTGYETNLCNDCARALDFDSALSLNSNFDFNLDIENEIKALERDFFGNVFDDNFFTPTTLLERNSKKCKQCGSTFNDFLRRGQLGCNKCYDCFEDEIRDMLENMDNPTDLNLEFGSEIGKIMPTELDKLNDEFNRAIAEERYEDAGEIKKKINNLRNNDKKENE